MILVYFLIYLKTIRFINNVLPNEINLENDKYKYNRCELFIYYQESHDLPLMLKKFKELIKNPHCLTPFFIKIVHLLIDNVSVFLLLNCLSITRHTLIEYPLRSLMCTKKDLCTSELMRKVMITISKVFYLQIFGTDR